jgi:hypothetical protein
MHDDCAGLGATCKALPEKDGVYSSQILKDGEIEKGSAGSGNFGHDGRKGKKGGSSRGGGLRRIGAKRDSKPGTRKKAAKKFREKRKQDKTLSDVPQNLTKMSKKQRAASVDKLSKLPAKELRKRQDLNDKQIKIAFDARNTPVLDNLRVREDILREAVDKKEFGSKSKSKKSKKPTQKKDLTKMSKGELNAGFLNAKNHKERTSFAEELLKDFGDNTVAKSKKDIPKLKDRIQPASKEIADKGKNAIFRSPGGAMGLGKVLQGASGKFWNGNFGKIEEVIPVFKADLTTRAQSDAPNYQAASTPQRCANCHFFLGDPGRDWCDLFDFTADPDYHCDDWEAQRPDEIPGYVANKGDLAALTEGILTLRGGQN